MAESPVRYHVMLLQGRTGPYTSIDRSTARHLRNLLDDKVTTKKEETEIDVWMHSTGGDANAAYKIFLDLRNRATRVRTLIPDRAKSAATLFALGMDEIHMGATAELGPLDVQIEHPDRENETISGLDAVGSLDYLNNLAIQMTPRYSRLHA